MDTATDASAPSYVTVFPAGAQRPTASSLDMNAGQTVANLVLAKVGTGGAISLYNNTGTTHLVVDVVGWFPSGGSYRSFVPARLAGRLRAVGEREECVRGQHRPLRLLARLRHGQAHALDAVHLARADADQLPVLGEHDGVGLDVLDHLPRKQQVVQLLRRRVTATRRRQPRWVRLGDVRRLHEQPARNALVVQAGVRPGGRGRTGEGR